MAEERTNMTGPRNDKEIEKAKKVGAVLAISGLIFMLGLFVLVQKDSLKLHPKSMNPENLENFISRIAYALRYQTLLVFWLLFAVITTIYGRITTDALNPLEKRTEHRVEIFKNVLTNSFESIVISVLSQLILVSFAEPPTILKMIPLINIVQFIGRVAFFAGYPMKRSFGMVCTLLPNILMNGYNLFKFGSFVGFY